MGNSWQRSRKSDSIIEASIRIAGSLVVASLTLSHVTATETITTTKLGVQASYGEIQLSYKC
jgi:hypothetical protein